MSILTYSLIWAVVKILIVVGFIVNVAALLTWAERRQSAMMQDRVGPNRADMTVFGKKVRLGGLLHVVADAVKFFFKEDFVPPNSDKLLHALAPMLSLFPPLVVLAVVPFADTLNLGLASSGPAGPGGFPLCSALHVDWWGVASRSGTLTGAPMNCVDAAGKLTVFRSIYTTPTSMQILEFNPGILYIFALAGMGIVGATIAGWSSDNKFSLLGGLRAASQLVSYEVAMGLSLVGAMMIYGTIRLDEMAHWQGDHVWGIFVQPLAFVLFFAAATAESKRAPFDLPEGESEIVAGYLLEYSGMKFGMFYMGEFIEVATSSAFLVAVFLGGYNMPFLHRDGITIALGDASLWHQTLPLIVVLFLQAGAFFSKVIFICWLQLFVRWTLPRFRYDQLMKLGWRILLPTALANIFLTGIVVLAVDRATDATFERLDWLADLVNLLLGATILGAVGWLVIGFFMPPNAKRRARTERIARLRDGHREQPKALLAPTH